MARRRLARRVLALLLLLLLPGVRAQASLAADEPRRFKWSNKAIATEIASTDLLNMAITAVEDLANGGKLAGIPLEALASVSRHLGRLVPQTPSYFTDPMGPVLSSTYNKRQGRYALALAPVACGSGGDLDTYAVALCNGSLPDAADVWARLLKRSSGGFVREERVPVSFLMVTFVNWFHDDTFRTLHETNGSLQWIAKDSISLAQVYGDTVERQAALRTFAGGKMKTSTGANGETLPPRYLDVVAASPDFTMWTNATGFTPADPHTMFAFGDPRFNMHPGHMFWGTFALRTHNHLCDLVAAERPAANDEEIFQTARLLLFHIVMKIRAEDFVSDIISPFRDSGRLAYAPDALRQLPEFRTDYTYVWLEFNQLYRWHALIPDELELANGSTVTMAQAMFRPSTFDVLHEGIAPLAGALHRTRMGQFGARNVPSFLQFITLSAIQDNRAQRLRSFNDYREFFSLPRLTTFEQFGMPPDATAAMADLYGSPDNVDYFVGIMCETAGAIRHNIFGDAELLLVAMFAVQDLVSLDIVRLPELWSEAVLTTAGKHYVQSFTLAKYLSGVLNTTVHCPFLTEEVCTPQSDFAAPGSTTLQAQNLCDFCATDYFADWFYQSTGYYTLTIAIIFVSCNIGVILVYMAAYVVAKRCVDPPGPRRPGAVSATTTTTTTSSSEKVNGGFTTSRSRAQMHAFYPPTDAEDAVIGSESSTTTTTLPAKADGAATPTPLPAQADGATTPAPLLPLPAKADGDVSLSVSTSSWLSPPPSMTATDMEKAEAPAITAASVRKIASAKTRLILATSVTASAVLTTAMSGVAGWVFMRIIFSDSLDVELDSLYVPLLCCCGALISLYTAEACVRVVARPKVTLFIHHIITISVFVVQFTTTSIWVLRLGCILACFAFWEFPILLAMMVSRLKLFSDRVTYAYVFPVCVGLYIATRIAEIVLLCMFFACSAARMVAAGPGQTALFVTLTLLSFVFMFMQFAILRPVYHTWRKHAKRD